MLKDYSETRKKILWKAPIRTDAVKRVTALMATKDMDAIYFGSPTPLVSDKFIKE